jgi:hypothetical protein
MTTSAMRKAWGRPGAQPVSSVDNTLEVYQGSTGLSSQVIVSHLLSGGMRGEEWPEVTPGDRW